MQGEDNEFPAGCNYLMNGRRGDDRVTIGSLLRRDVQHGRPLAVAVVLARRGSRRRRRDIVRRRRGRHRCPRRGNPLHVARLQLFLI